jgi:ADP-heptose:LPS heptosyltransferase
MFHQTALGDFALALPVLRGLAASGGDDGEAWLIAPWSRIELAMALVPGVRGVDIEMFEFSRLHVPGGPSRLSPMVSKLFDGADRIVSFIATEDGEWAGNVRRLAPQAELVCVPPRPPADWAEPVHDYYAAVLDRAGMGGVLAPEPTVSLSRRGGPIVVHPGSGGVAKQWPRERFDALIERLHVAEPDRPIRVIVGEAEVDRWPPDVLVDWQARHHLAVIRTAAGLLDAMRDAAVYVGNDAGPTHVAAQAGLPTVAIFGPTDPRVWAPVGPCVTPLRPDTPADTDWLAVAPAAEAVARALR